MSLMVSGTLTLATNIEKREKTGKNGQKEFLLILLDIGLIQISLMENLQLYLLMDILFIPQMALIGQRL